MIFALFLLAQSLPVETKILPQLKLGLALVTHLELLCETATQREASKLAAAKRLQTFLDNFFSRVFNEVSLSKVSIQGGVCKAVELKGLSSGPIVNKAWAQ